MSPTLLPAAHIVSQTARVCRLLTPFPESLFCAQHAPQTTPSEVDLTAAFGEEILTDRQSATPLNTFLGVLALLLVENRISPRRAAVLAYISSLLLRSLPAVQLENPPQFIFNIPRPKSGPQEASELESNVAQP
jgi:hypothetical protein